MKIMKLVLTATLFSFLCITAGIAQKTLPNVELKTLDGKSVKLEEVVKNGQITILSAWATWCAPCKKELDAIADFYPDWQKDYNVQLVAISIDTQRALSKVAPLVAEKRWEYTVLSDINQQFMNAMGFQAIPQTFLVNQEGKIVYSHNGYVPGDEYELEKEIKKLLE